MGLTNPGPEVLSRLMDSVKEVSGLPERKNVFKKMHENLVRRIKLLSPLFEELRDSNEELGREEIKGFELLRAALDSSIELLKSLNDGSKLYQCLQMYKNVTRFHQLTEQIEAALSKIPYDKLDLSEEVREQIELVHVQFRRAKGRPDSPDLQLDHDLAIAQKEKDPDPVILRRLSEKLHLRRIIDLKKESLAFYELVITSGGDPGDCFEQIATLLKKLKDFVLTENFETELSEGDKGLIKHRSPIIPDYFRCPLSLELMKDPVIVSTGQTYGRSCIQKWLDAGHKTCPKTQEKLLHTTLMPNYILKSLIALWCESNGVELPKNQGASRSEKSGRSVSDCNSAAIDSLLRKLANGSVEERRALLVSSGYCPKGMQIIECV